MIQGEGKVILKMTSEKNLTLNNLLYVQEIHKNLVSRLLLDKNRFRLMVEFYKVILTKFEMFMSKGYIANELFKLNVITVKPNNMNKASFYLVASVF